MILVQLLDIVLPVFLCIAAGFAWARGKLAFDNAFVTQLVMYIGTPCLLIATFDQVRPEPAAFGQIFLAALTAFVGVGLVSWGLLRLLGLDPRDFLPALTFPNTGNMGLPLVLFAFGPEGLAFGIVVFALSAVGHFTVGISVSRGAFKPRELLTVPILPALTVGILLVVLDLNLPPVLGRTVELLGNLTIPLMLLALGVSLARLPLRRFGRAALLGTLRIGLGAASGFAAAWAFGLGPVATGALVLQCSMPIAVYSYLFAERYGRASADVAGAVIVSTLMTLVAAPVLLLVLR
ncbi:AEC family transporter [Algihabitans albus]|uniref:AEC family transporter n=1 Tax=Algihabitans albus TaxID=2164067 RepID=UPI0035CF2951